MSWGIIVLAAGSSSRMGQSKQLLLIDGVPLLKRSVTAALGAGADTVVVVLGSNESAHRETLKGLPVEFTVNQHWYAGMGKSIKTGLECLLNLQPDLSQVILMVCDQPYLDTNQLISLRSVSLESPKPIIASYYNNTPGVPALFTRRFFPQLLALDDSHGAKKVIQQNLQDAELLPFPEGEVDLDTLEDYLNFLNR